VSPSCRLHVHESGSGFTIPTNTCFLVQDDNASATNCICDFVSGDAGKVRWLFGDPMQPDISYLEYDNSTDDMKLHAEDDIKLDGDNVKLDADALQVDVHLLVDEGMRVNRTAVSSSTYIVDSGATKDYYLGVTYTLSGAVAITLPSALDAGTGRMLLIVDEGGGAGTNNITFTSSSGIRGASTINTNYGTRRFISNGSNMWIGY